MGKLLLREIAEGIAKKANEGIKPFFSAADKAAQELPRTKGTGAEFMRELEKTKGVKPAEIQHRKLDEIKSKPKMTKEEFVKEVQARPPAQVEERILREPTDKDLMPIAEKLMAEDATEYVNQSFGKRKFVNEEKWDDFFDDEFARLMRSEKEYYLDKAREASDVGDVPTVAPRYTEYQLPGGENYREILLKLPEAKSEREIADANMKAFTDKVTKRLGFKGWDFDSMTPSELVEYEALNNAALKASTSRPAPYKTGHWEDPNVLAHMRVSDRVGPNGEKVLHVEEIQSDWHQAGRKKGYKGEAAKKAEQEFKSYASELASKYDLNPDQNLAMYATMKRMQPDEVAKYEQLQSAWVNSKEGVPDAPFKKNWQELAMNRLLSYAAENGYDRVALTPGAEQASRYDLSKHISKIDYNKFDSGQNELKAWDKDGKLVLQKYGPTPDEVSDLIGKEAADKLFAVTPKDNHMGGQRYSLIGEDLQVGGEGMQGFYDKMLPDYLNKLGKKYGVEVDTMPLTVPPKDSMAVSKYPGGEDYIMGKTTWSEFLAQNPEAAKDFQSGLHSFRITPEMRKDITEQGFPLYSAVAAPVGLGAVQQDVLPRVGITDNEDAMKLDLMDQELREPEQNFDKGGAAFGVFPQMKGKRSKQDREAAKNVPVDLLRGAVSGVLGAPGDIESLIRLLPGLNEETVLPTSEDIEKRLPFKSDTPVSRAATGLGQLAGGFYTGPGSPLKAIAGVPKAIKHGAEEFAKASAMGVPHVVKPKGGNWLTGNVEKQLGRMKMADYTTPEQFAEMQQSIDTAKRIMGDDPTVQRTVAQMENELNTAKRNNAINSWIDRNLTNYVKKEMGTPEDPVRRLAEQDILHIKPIGDQYEVSSRLMNKRKGVGFNPLGEGKSEAARFWERQADISLEPYPAGSYKHGSLDESLLEANPWLKNVPDEEMIHYSKGLNDLGFDHIVDVLRQDVREGRIRPEQLSKVSMEQAVRRTYEYDQEMAKKMREAQIKATEGMPVHKEYPEGYKWIELTKPKSKLPDDFDTWSKQDQDNFLALPDPQSKKALEDALKYEGETMGHCVGGYCPDVLEGRSRIYSLRDAKGEPHVTVEVQPPRVISQSEAADQARKEGLRGQEFAERVFDLMEGKNQPQRIAQIKGKQNRAPKEEYLPYVQDFVRGGEWSDIGDFKNTGLIRQDGQLMTPAEHSDWLLKQLGETGEQGMSEGGKPKYPTPEMREKLRQLRESFLPAANEAERQKRMQQNMEQTNRKVSFSDDPEMMRQEVHMNGGGAAFGVFPQMTGKRSKQDKEAAKGMPLAAARGFVAGTMGLPSDVLNIGGTLYSVATGQEVGEVPYGSDYWKDVLPLKDESAAGKAATELGGMFGGAGMGRAGKAVVKEAARLINDAHLYGQGPLAPITPQAMKIFIGPNAKTWNQAAADRALKMEKAGEDPAKIWQQTGTFRGADGVLRQEISDRSAKFVTPDEQKEKVTTLKEKMQGLKEQIRPTPQKDLFPKALNEAKKDVRDEIGMIRSELKGRSMNPRTTGIPAPYIFEHPELYKAYPELYSLKINTEMGGDALGSLSILPRRGDFPGEMVMDISTKGLTRNPTSTTLHEMQHAVQTLERMGPGGSPRMAFADPKAYEILERMRAEALKPATIEEFNKANRYPENEVEAAYQQYLKTFPKELSRSIDRDLQSRAAMEYYKRLAGEAEARAVQDRQMMTPAERLENPPPSSYDVPQEDLIVKPPREFGAGGEVARMLKLARAPAKSKQEIEAIAQRIAPQVTGEFVRGPKGTASVAGKTQKQFAREKELPVEFTDVKSVPKVEVINPESLKGMVVTGIPGDPTVTGKSLVSVGKTKLDSPSPQHGGPLYGLGRNDDIFWASGIDPAGRVQTVAKEAMQAYDAPVAGQYIMMGPDSINYALHFADANLSAIDPSKMTKRQIEEFNELIRFGDAKSGPRPAFPGIENKEESYLHFAFDPHLRKYFNKLMQMPTVTKRFNLPSGQDIRFAITEEPLRNLETGVTGYSMGHLAPEVPKSALPLSEHPTYSHDIPGRFMGGLKYPTPYELSFPDTLKTVRENPEQASQEFGSLKYVGPRQIYDQQMIDELKMYEEAMKKLTGKKKGGKVDNGLIEVKKRKAKA